MRDPENRTGAWWEPIKFIAFDPAGTHYLTVGADMRVRCESYTNNLWGDGPAPNDAYGWFRVMPYADLHLGSNVRLFGQLMEPGQPVWNRPQAQSTRLDSICFRLLCKCVSPWRLAARHYRADASSSPTAPSA